MSERERDHPGQTDEQHDAPRDRRGGHGEPALLEVALVEVERRRLVGALHGRAGVVREAEPIGDGRGGINVGDDAGAPRGVGGERVRLTLRIEQLVWIAPRRDHGPELVAVRG